MSGSSMRSSSRRRMRNESGTTPPADPECTPSVSTSTRTPAIEHATQGGGDPEPVVVGRARVEPDHQAHRTEPVAQGVEVRRQVGAARLLARLDEHQQAGVVAPGLAQRLDGGERGEGGVAVVGAAPAVEAVAVEHRLPRAESVAPAGHLRLLVEVAVEQDGVVGQVGSGRRDLAEHHRRAAVDLEHLHGHAVDGPVLAPLPDQLGGPGHVPVLAPRGVERRRHVGDADVVVQPVDDVGPPAVVDDVLDGGGIEWHGPSLLGAGSGGNRHRRRRRARMEDVLLDAIDHVQLAMPPGGEELATWFYEEVLGVPRVPKPPHLAVRGGCWFESGIVRIHLGVQEDFVPATKAHPAFAVSDLDRLQATLEARGVNPRREDDPIGPPAVYVDDPFGNRLEFRAERPVEDVAEYTDDHRRGGRRRRRRATGAAVGVRAGARPAQDRRAPVVHRRRPAPREHRRALVARGHARRRAGRPGRRRRRHRPRAAPAAGPRHRRDRRRRHRHLRRRVGRDQARARACRRRPALRAAPRRRRQQLRAAWDEYEHGDTAEARFARVFDRLSPLLLNLGASGLSWRRWGVSADRVREVLAPIQEAPELWRFVEAMLDRAVADGLLPAGGSGLLLP